MAYCRFRPTAAPPPAALAKAPPPLPLSLSPDPPRLQSRQQSRQQRQHKHSPQRVPHDDEANHNGAEPTRVKVRTVKGKARSEGAVKQDESEASEENISDPQLRAARGVKVVITGRRGLGDGDGGGGFGCCAELIAFAEGW